MLPAYIIWIIWNDILHIMLLTSRFDHREAQQTTEEDKFYISFGRW